MRGKGKFLAAGTLLALSGGLLAAGAGSARADTVITLPGSVTYLTQTLPDTLGGNSYLFISDNGAITVDSVAGRAITTLDAGDGIGGLALSADGGTLYASVTSGANADSVAAITVSSITGTLKQAFYPLAAGDAPGSLAVQSGKVWVSYSTGPDADQIGAIGLAGGTFEAAAAPGSWTSAVQLAADPDDTGVLAAVSDQSPAEAATYDTAAVPATARAAQGDLGRGSAACVYPGEIAVAPGGKKFLAGCDGPPGAVAYAPGDIATGTGSYNANGGSTSQAIAVAVAADGAVAVSNRTTIYVYNAAGTTLENILTIPAGNKIDEGYGLEWVNATDLAAVFQNTTTGAYTVTVYDKAELLRPRLFFAAAATTGFGHPVKLKGKVILPSGAGDTQKVTITRSGPGGTVTLPAVNPSNAGLFTATDTPKAVGTYTYTATSGAVSLTATAKVTRNVPALTLARGSATVGYKTVVHVTATLGKTYVSRVVTISAQVNGSSKAKVIAKGKVNAKGQLTVAYSAPQSTTFRAAYAGDADDTAAKASAAVAVRARVTETLSGEYGSKKSGGTAYLLYHHTGKVTVAIAVAPGHPGACVEAETQVYAKGAWHASAKTGCAKLSSASKKTVQLTVAKAALGPPYRVRVDYLSNGPQNADGSSGWQYFIVAK